MKRACSRLFRAFSFPGQLGSHCTPEVPGSIHEGGELGYSISHAFGAAFDNPDLIVSVVVGDGEAETGPLATSWHSNKFLNPIRDGAVLPILHLNGYKIANPTLLARITAGGTRQSFQRIWMDAARGREVTIPEQMHQKMAATVETCVQQIRAIQQEARSTGKPDRPRWPMIILRSPKGWTGPKEVDGHKVEGFLASPPGARARRANESRAPANRRAVDAQLPARGTLRRARHAGARTSRTCRPKANAA